MATNAGFWTDYGDDAATYELLSKRSPNRYHLNRMLKTRGLRNYGEILSTLLEDATPSSTASVVTSQIDSVATTGGTNSQGGVRGVTSNETVDLNINSASNDASANTARAVVAADVTAIQTEILPGGSRSLRSPSTYPTDASGNGGGGKLS